MSWLFYKFIYQRLMRLAHRFDWHHAPMHGPLQDGATQRWCQWCGFRETYRQSRYGVTGRVTSGVGTDRVGQDTRSELTNGSICRPKGVKP